MSIKKILIVDDAPEIDLLEPIREAILRPVVYYEPCLVLNKAETKAFRLAFPQLNVKIITTKPFPGRFIASNPRKRKRK